MSLLSFLHPIQPLLSTTLGSLSIVCWILVMVPQIIENHSRQSTESLNPYFILLWTLGDIFNLVGSFYSQLSLPIIILALYYILTDSILLFQIGYYGTKEQVEDGETSDLLHNDIVEYGSSANVIEIVRDSNEVVNVQPGSYTQQHISTPPTNQNLSRSFKSISPIFLLFPIIYLTSSFPHPLTLNLLLNQPHPRLIWWAQTCGWISTFLFCLAKLPQIWTNFKRSSTDGLSMYMFVLAGMGNFTLILSILTESLDPTYLLINAPWLFGAALPFIFDFIIFYQYYLYKVNTNLEPSPQLP